MLLQWISTAECFSIFINFPKGKQKLCIWLTDENFNVTRIGISFKKRYRLFQPVIRMGSRQTKSILPLLLSPFVTTDHRLLLGYYTIIHHLLMQTFMKHQLFSFIQKYFCCR